MSEGNQEIAQIKKSDNPENQARVEKEKEKINSLTSTIPGDIVNRLARSTVARDLMLDRARKRLSVAEENAAIDPLTNTFRRPVVEKRLADLMKRPNGNDLAILMFDIDHFKKVNDARGHPEGDKALYEVAGILKTGLRPKDMVARWGGEEFVVVMEIQKKDDPDHPAIIASARAEEIRQEVEKSNSRVTTSIGVTMVRPGDTVESAMKRVDEHLYRGKNEGRNTVIDDFGKVVGVEKSAGHDGKTHISKVRYG